MPLLAQAVGLDPVNLITQLGALGLLAVIILWLTRRFNGKIDANTQATRENTKAHEELTRALRRLSEEGRKEHEQMLKLLRKKGRR